MNKQHTIVIVFAFLIICVVAYFIYFEHGFKKATAMPVYDSTAVEEKKDSIVEKYDSILDAWDSLRPIVAEVTEKIQYYESLKADYNIQIVKTVDSSLVADLRRKLSLANNEISKLNGELAVMKYKRPEQLTREIQAIPESKIIEEPDDNALIIFIDGSSKKGNVAIPENLMIYLIPYDKSKRYRKYETSCDNGIEENVLAKKYNGLYYFNDVESGKYLVKICTYYGNYQAINKQTGRQNIAMKLSPPLQ